MQQHKSKKRVKHLRTIENPYMTDYLSGNKTAWDYTGPHQVIRRKYHMKDGKPQSIIHVVVWDGTYKF
jgi:hypothetical protein